MRARCGLSLRLDYAASWDSIAEVVETATRVGFDVKIEPDPERESPQSWRRVTISHDDYWAQDVLSVALHLTAKAQGKTATALLEESLPKYTAVPEHAASNGFDGHGEDQPTPTR